MHVWVLVGPHALQPAVCAGAAYPVHEPPPEDEDEDEVEDPDDPDDDVEDPEDPDDDVEVPEDPDDDVEDPDAPDDDVEDGAVEVGAALAVSDGGAAGFFAVVVGAGVVSVELGSEVGSSVVVPAAQAARAITEAKAARRSERLGCTLGWSL